MTWAEIFFSVVFLGQIFLISHYFPTKILGRMKYVREKFPPEQYPRLYPQPIEYYKIGHRAFELINRAIVVLGFVILFAIIFVVDHAGFADDGFISEFWPMLYGAIQFVPILLLEFSEYNQLRLMRRANSATTRKADLRPRRLFDFVSPVLLLATIGFFLAALVFDQYLHDFVASWENKTIQRAMVLTGANLFFAAIGSWQLYGRKQNPHQAFGDRAKQIGAQLRSMVYVSMAMSVFFMVQAADQVYDMDFLDAPLLSLYFQVIVFLSIGHLLRSLNLEEIDFDVYRNDEAVP